VGAGTAAEIPFSNKWRHFFYRLKMTKTLQPFSTITFLQRKVRKAGSFK